GEQLVLAVLPRAVDVAAGRALLVRPEQQPAALLAHVPGAVGFAQHAHLGQALLVPPDDLGMRLGDDELVLDRDHRDIQADHRAGLAGKAAGGAHDVLAGDGALVGLDPPFARRRPADANDPGLAVDLGAAIARALGH